MFDFFFDHGSYLGIVLLLVLSGCGLPIPEEVVVVGTGLLAAQGVLDPSLAFGACLLGAMAGDIVVYSIGYHFGHGLLKEHPRFAHLLHAEREQKYEAMIVDHGFKLLFLARFMVGVRSAVYLSAGVLRIPFRRFLLMDMLCATSVVGLSFGLSYAFGEQIARWVRQAGIGMTALVLLVVVGAVAFFVRRGRQRRARLEELRKARAGRGESEESERGKDDVAA